MSRRGTWFLATAFTLCLCCSWPTFLRAQSTPNQVNAGNTTGTTPYASYGGVRENINLSTGDLNLQIPLLTIPGRHGRNLTLNIFYDSKLWNLHFFVDDFGIYHYWRDWQDDGFWRFGIPLLEATFVDYGPQFGQSDTACYTNFILTLNDGSKHTFANRASCAAVTTRNQLISWPSLNIPLTDSQDSSFIRLDTTSSSDIVAHLKDGTQIHFNLNLPLALPMQGDGSAIVEANKIEDTEGNTLTLSGAVAGSFFGTAIPVNSITDTAGRVVTLTYGSGSSSISYKDSTGTTQTISLHGSSFPFNYTVAVPSDAAPGSGSFSQLSSITLPNGLAYTFAYNNAMGELNKITYPTGATPDTILERSQITGTSLPTAVRA